MKRYLKRLVRDDSGATAMEYGVMTGLIAGVIVLAVTNIGTNINGIYGVLNTALQGVPGA